MGREVNEDWIRDLEKKIEEGTADIIQLKRARNSLLNISTRVPPEILGSIFRWRITPDTYNPHPLPFPRGSHNFLLVCHHWFEIGSNTPELWGYWRNTLMMWERWYKRSKFTPVDLVLNGFPGNSSDAPFDEPLQGALRDLAKHDTIRSVQLWNGRSSTMTSILSALTPKFPWDVQYSSIESISLRHVDASEFFARYHFPKLRYLRLSRGVQISSWEHLGLHTSALTTLSLTIENVTPVPTTAQLLFILTSNPRLQNLTLAEPTIPHDDGSRSTVLVPLYHLKRLSIHGEFQPVFQLLHRLDYPKVLDKISLRVSRFTVDDISDILGPFIHGRIQCDGRVREGLGIFVNSYPGVVSIQATATNNVDHQRETFAWFVATLRGNHPPHDGVRLCADLVAYAPVEDVVLFGGQLNMDEIRRIAPTMPKVQELHLKRVRLVDRFLQSDPEEPLTEEKLFPSLKHLHVEHVVSNEGHWRPLLSYLAHQTSDGKQISFTISRGPGHICRDVVDEIGGLVEKFVITYPMNGGCPYHRCLGGSFPMRE